MKGKMVEVDGKREEREKRIIRIPNRYLPLSNFYSAGGRRSSSSTRSVLLKKKPVRARVQLNGQKMKDQPDEEQRLAQTGDYKEASASDEESAVKKAVVKKMESTPTPNSSSVKRWVQLKLENNHDDSNKLVGLQCKIYWPLDDAWYSGRIKEYNTQTGYHHVMYDDGDEEDVLMKREKIQFLISREEVQQLRFSPYSIIVSDDLNQMVRADQSYDDRHELRPGDVTWAKLTGHAAWPALILDEELVAGCKGLLRKRKDGQKSYPVQFFGTHDLARVKVTETTPFFKGFVSCLHHKCKKPTFVRGLEEAKLYLNEEKLPEGMLLMQNDTTETEVSKGASEDDDEVEDGGEVEGSGDGDGDEKNVDDEEIINYEDEEKVHSD